MPICPIQYRNVISNFQTSSKIKIFNYSKPDVNIRMIFLLLLVLTNIQPNYERANIMSNNFNDTKHSYTDRDTIHNIVHTARISHNRYMKAYNGNINGITKINMMQYNKGNSAYATKEHFLNEAIIKHNIDIACISKANITTNYLQNNNVINGYICETKPMSDTIDTSRNIILINNRIPYTRRYDLECPMIAIIWIETKINNKHSILVMGGYRQWRLLRQLNIQDSHKTNKQIQ